MPSILWGIGNEQSTMMLCKSKSRIAVELLAAGEVRTE